MIEIHQMIPYPEELLSLDVSEVALVLLRHLASRPDIESLGVRKVNFFSVRSNPAFAYSRANSIAGKYTDKITELLNKAWEWLLNENLLIPIPGAYSSEVVQVSQEGYSALSKAGFDQFRVRSLLQTSMLHPSIAEVCVASISRGQYDIAIFAAFRALENNVREACKFASGDIGVALMRKAFSTKDGPLRDNRLGPGEQEAVMHIFAGAIGSFKNPTSHRLHAFDRLEEAIALVLFANYLMNQVDELTLENGLKS